MLSRIEQLWYGHTPLRWILFPLSLVYRVIVGLRRAYLQRFRQQQFPVPIIVVGNLTVGGVGKTPLVIALAQRFKQRGLRVGIVSRGYGANTRDFPYEVADDADAALVGDEPLLIAKKTNCPVVIAPKRVQAVQYLLDNYQSQIIISDDGLQHYAMGRAVEIVVIDGVRGLGNGFCLPAGPLREGRHRLREVDFLVVNGGSWPDAYLMDLLPGPLTQLATNNPVPLEVLSKNEIAAVAAIGHPERFFSTLTSLGLVFQSYSFPDHHHFLPSELAFKEKNVVMTEKDAVKCKSFASDTMYFLPVEARISDLFWDALSSHGHIEGCFNDDSSSIG